MSNFATFDGSECEIPPIDPPTEASPPPNDDRSEIRIVAGPGGSFIGSKVYINGEFIPRLTAFSISGDMATGSWHTVIEQVVRDA